MKENEWISIKDKLPKIDEKIEILTIDNVIEESTLDYIGYNLLRFNNCNLIENKQITHWRLLTKKRPDFSKLRKGNCIYLEAFKSTYDRICFVISVDSIGLITSHYKDLSGLNTYNPPESIKKITRINLEEKTFEEI